MPICGKCFEDETKKRKKFEGDDVCHICGVNLEIKHLTKEEFDSKEEVVDITEIVDKMSRGEKLSEEEQSIIDDVDFGTIMTRDGKKIKLDSVIKSEEK